MAPVAQCLVTVGTVITITFVASKPLEPGIKKKTFTKYVAITIHYTVITIIPVEMSSDYFQIISN